MDKEYTIKTSEDIKIIVVRKKTLGIAILSAYLVVLMLLFAYPVAEEAYAEQKINCGAFPTRLNAQQAFDGNEMFYKRLDRDGDKKVCEDYKYKN